MRAILSALVLALLVAGCSAERPAKTGQPSMPAAPSRAELRACLADLGTAKASFASLPDRYFGPGCATLGTVQLSRLASDDAALALANIGPVACPLAQSFAGWARFGADRAARQILGSPLVRIETMGSFNCRNVAGSGRRSAHAVAQAIDVAGFVLADGRRLTVRDHWADPDPAVRRFFATIHASACKRFGTVLGPAYNAAHRDHLHFERSQQAFCR